MCGIAGFCNFNQNTNNKQNIINKMIKKISHRGNDDTNIFMNDIVTFGHARLSIRDLENGKQPMQKKKYTIVYNGEIYNTSYLKSLINKDYIFQTTSDTEVILACYEQFKENCANLLEGIFSFVIWDEEQQQLFLCRDRFGIKPLYYSYFNNTLVFASEIKSLFEYPNINPQLNKDSFNELFGVFPSRTEGYTLFENIKEVNFASYIILKNNSFVQKKYWQLVDEKLDLTYEQVVSKTQSLLYNSITSQIVSDVPISTFLSGGIDSSIITGVIANELKKKNKQLDTYSFDYKNNDKYFISNKFQVDTDEKWVKKVVKQFDTNHKYLIADNSDLINNLYKAVDAKDYAGMADIDCSLLYFCNEISKNHKVSLSGECADEIFGGYPWFFEKNINSFPWIRNIDYRLNLLNQNIVNKNEVKNYINKKYTNTLSEINTDDHIKKITYLNMKWFMNMLLERTDRMSMHSSLEVRVPYADHNLIQFLWNVPWNMKYTYDRKSLLRDSFSYLLPEELIKRKKSPYPKTYNPEYEKLLIAELRKVIKNEEPITKILDKNKIEQFLKSEKDYASPWFGQLMAGPQLIAFYLQINYWLKKYQISI